MDDRYQIIQRTAVLPFGTQFEATDLLISREAQIHRFTKPGKNAPKDWKKRYEKVSGALSTLSHMGLPIVYDRGVNSAGPYLIRQWVNEPKLTSRLEQGPLSEYELWELAQQLLEIHSIGLNKDFFHGALLLDQICYATRPGGEKRYYMTDFGLSELHNQINGTKEYMGMPCLISIEQAEGESPSEASEIFSIGQLLYLCMAENHPFASNAVEEMAELHKNYPLAPISSFSDDVPQDMVEWIVRMTAVDPEDRFSTYAEALENLPEPVQSAPIPVIPTATTFQQVTVPTGQIAAVQQSATAQPGTQAVSYPTYTQAVSANQSSANSAIKQLLKEPLIVSGAVVALILIVVGIFVFSGDDESAEGKKVTVSHQEELGDFSESGGSKSDGSSNSADKAAEKAQAKAKAAEKAQAKAKAKAKAKAAEKAQAKAKAKAAEKAQAKAAEKAQAKAAEKAQATAQAKVLDKGLKKDLEKGLIVVLNFDSSLKASNDSSILVEKTKASATYQQGLDGEALVIDKDQYYRLPLKGHLPEGDFSNFTISFWVKNLNPKTLAFVSDKPWKKGGRKIDDKDNSEFWQWTPENSLKQSGKSSAHQGWNMVTLVFSDKSNQVHLYNNGEMMGESSTSSIQSLDSEKYLYIGCDSRKKLTFSSPKLVDQLYIWDRKLSSKEIRALFDMVITL